MSKLLNFAAILLLILSPSGINGDASCDVVLEAKENEYLAQATLGGLIQSFIQVFNKLQQSEAIKANLDQKTLNIIRLLISTQYFEKIETMVKAVDINLLNLSVQDLCREASQNELWLKCIVHGILKLAFELRTVLLPLLTSSEPFNYSPWPSPLISGKRSDIFDDLAFTPRLG